MVINSLCGTDMHASIITLLVFILTYLITGLYFKGQSNSDISVIVQKKKDILNKHHNEDFDFFMNS